MTQVGEPVGQITADDYVSIEDSNGVAPTNIIRVGDPFTVWIDFDLAGALNGLLVGILRYSVRYWVNGLGSPAPANPIPSRVESTTYGQLGYRRADTERTVPANTLAAGVYQLGAIVTFRLNNNGNLLHYPLTVFTLPKIIEIYA
ncbi:hypothetical protein AB1484_25695 [Parafrankia sp. FMc6]|uniref:hypothetical protein n=1 Tax=Parafrankia soli TaxID=2599596 RepID=UPI0034D75A1E